MLENLSDNLLLNQTASEVLKEKKHTAKVLEYLAEIERRKLYADLGLHSLFSYCTKILKYSEGEATVRVNATRLIKDIPEVKVKIEAGEINLTAASKIQTFFKNEKPNSKEKQKLIKDVTGKSTRETEKIIDKKSKSPKKKSKKIILDDKLLNKLELIQSEYDDCSEYEAIHALIDKELIEIKRRKLKRKSKSTPENQRYLKREIKEEVDKRAQGRCEYISPLTKKRCPCRSKLQYDHIKPVGIGGMSTKENLRKLCPTHNIRAAIKVFGPKIMEKSQERSRC